MEKGSKTLIFGNVGTGKTTSLATLLTLPKGKYEVIYIFTESTSQLSFSKACKRLGVPVPQVSMIVAKPSLRMLKDMARANQAMPEDVKMKWTDPDKVKYSEWKELLLLIGEIPTSEGKKSLEELDSSKIVVIDGLSDLTRWASNITVGGNSHVSWPNFSSIQATLENLIVFLTDSCNCHIVLTAHAEMESDLVSLLPKITLSTIGKQLAPKVMKKFFDIVYSYTSPKGGFLWANSHPQAQVKIGFLPVGTEIPQDLTQIISIWEQTDA